MRPVWLLTLALAACGTSPTPQAPSGPSGWSDADKAVLASLRLDTTLPADPTNRWADVPAAAMLGRQLFYDPALSPTERFSCATCHDPAKHFTDGLERSVAAGITARHAPGIEGAQAGPWYYWDGRADSLWSQAAGPVENPDEMASSRTHVARLVTSSYRDAYEALFGTAPDLSDAERFPPLARPDPTEPPTPAGAAWRSMSPEDQHTVDTVFVNALKAIAAFERTLVPGEAPFDRYVDAVLAGDATGGGHLDPTAVRGLQTFVGRGNCTSCHLGPFFTDRAFHNLGLPEGKGFDPGRSKGALEVAHSRFNCDGPFSDADDCPELRFLNPGFDDFRAAFKTPSLRNVADTAPYMHHGQLADLDAVFDFYSELPGEPLMGHRELTLVPLELTSAEREGLAAFLRSLSAPVRPEGLPPATN